MKVTVEVSGFSKKWSHYPVSLNLPLQGLLGDLSRRTEPEVKASIRRRSAKGHGRSERYRSRMSEDGKSLRISWDSAGNGSVYEITLEKGEPAQEKRYGGTGIGAGDAMTTGVPGAIGDLHVGLISRPQVLRGPNRSSDLVCTVTGFQGGMFLCRKMPDKELAYERPMRIFLPHLNHATVDWDGSGKTDLVCAEGGRVLLIRNLGDDDHPVFAQPEPLRTKDSPLEIEHLAKIDVVDWSSDGRHDLLVGTNDNSDYWPGRQNPWQNKECGVGFRKGYSDDGVWLGGREHASIALCRNVGTNEDPMFEAPVPVLAGGEMVDVEGGGKLGTGDLDSDGDLDVVFGEHLDKIWYFENAGTPSNPRILKGVPLRSADGSLLLNPQCMSEPIVADLNGDGVPDLVFGSEDGYIYLCENARPGDHPPVFSPPSRLEQRNPYLGTGVLSVPSAVDWDEDGDLDLILGCAAGYIEFFENVGTREEPKFRTRPERLKAAGKVIRIQAGSQGSIQGPNEAKWGYTNPVVCDWDGDGLQDIVLSDIMGEHLFFRNVGEAGRPILDEPRHLCVDGQELKTVWRTRPIAQDLDGDGVSDYACLDSEGYLRIHWRRRGFSDLELGEGFRPRYVDGPEIRLDSVGGKIGRTQLCAADWDGDGDWDVLFGAHETTPLLGDIQHTSVLFMENAGTSDSPVFKRPVPLRSRGLDPIDLGGHCCSPHAADWDGDGELDLLVGAENGNVYYFHRSYLEDRGQARVRDR